MSDQPTQELMLNPDNPSERAIMLEEREFTLAQRKANMLSQSGIVPALYKGSIPNCAIAMEMASRLKTGVMEIMQNLYIVHNTPAFSSKYLIAMINMSGILNGRLRFVFTGEKGTDSYGCYAIGTEAATGQELPGTEITIKMAKAEGWYGKNGSKWPTLTDQMLQYRAAAFWSRINAPEATMGMTTVEEQQDMNEKEINPGGSQAAVSDLNAQINADRQVKQSAVTAATVEPDNTGPATIEGQAEVVDEEPHGGDAIATEKTEAPAQSDYEPWPQNVNGVWVDSANTDYNQAVNLWPEGQEKPTVNADGTFRARPQRKAKEVVVERSNAFKAIESLISMANTEADIDSILQMPHWSDLVQGEPGDLQASIEAVRAEVLASQG